MTNTAPQPKNVTRSRPPQNVRLKVLQALTVMVWAAVFAAGIGRFKFAAKPPMRILLKTTPAQVRITIDHQRWRPRSLTDVSGVDTLNDNRNINVNADANKGYDTTPQSIDVAPGKHRVKIYREGYVAHVVTIEGDSGDTIKMDDVVLERSPSSNFGPMDIVVKNGDPELYIDIDDGFVSGKTPVNIDDLGSNAPHILMIYPHWPETTAAYRCRFRTPANANSEPGVIEISTKNDKIVSASNCQRLKTRPSK